MPFELDFDYTQDFLFLRGQEEGRQKERAKLEKKLAQQETLRKKEQAKLEAKLEQEKATKEQEKINTILALLQEGNMSTEKIAQITQVSVEYVRNIQKK